MSSVIDALPAGAFTLTGKTRGPAVNLGRNRYRKSQMMFMHEHELLDALVKMGWPTPKVHEQLVEAHEATLAELAATKSELAAMAEKAATLEKAIGWKPEPAAKPKPAAKAKSAKAGA